MNMGGDIMVYNQLYLSPAKPGLNKYLGNYISYIAKNSKSKVVKNRGMEHGLFGCIKGNYLPVNIKDLNTTIKYVRNKTQNDRCVLYHGFLSLSSEEVISQGYKSRTKWKDLLADKMNDVAKANNIKRENLEWIAAYHMKKDQSHCHLIFWDKNQEIKDPYLPQHIFDKKMEWIRGQFAKEIFHDLFKELYNQKDEAFKDLNSELHPFFDEFSSIINTMDDNEIKGLKGKLSVISADYADEEMINPKFSSKQLQNITQEILNIKEIVPKSGALKYEYMPKDIKEKIDEAAMHIIESNAACKSNYYSYLKTSEEIRKIYADTPESLEDAREYAQAAILRSVGNKILKSVKQLSHLEKEIDKQEWAEKNEIHKGEIAEDLVISIAFLLSRGLNSNRAKVNKLRKSELSKQAKIELAKELENKSLDWGQNEI